MPPSMSITPFPLRVDGPVTTPTSRLSVSTRCEMVASIIAGVLSDAYQMQQEMPHRPLSTLDPAVRRVYEGLGRATAHSLLLPERTMSAERRAVQAAADVLDNYDAMDEELGARVSSDVRRSRLKTAFLSALHTYQAEMARDGQ